MDTASMGGWDGMTDGKELWIQWQKLLDQTLVFKNSKRFEKMSPKQQDSYLKTMHQKLKAINEAAYEKDMDYINRIKTQYGIQ